VVKATETEHYNCKNHCTSLKQEFVSAEAIAEVFSEFHYVGKYDGQEDLVYEVLDSVAVALANKLYTQRRYCCARNMKDKFLTACGTPRITEGRT